MKSKIAQHPLTHWLKHNFRFLALIHFAGTALLCALVSFHIAITLNPTYAIFFAIVIVGILAAGGVVINLLRDPRKRKNVDRNKHKRDLLDLDSQYTPRNDGEVIEGLEEKPKRKTNQ